MNFKTIKTAVRQKLRIGLPPARREQSAVFVHVPKTAGGSLRQFCRRNNICVYGHDIRDPGFRFFQENENSFGSLFSFAFVRDPLSRAISSFSFLSKGGITPGDKKDSIRHVNKYEGDFVSFVHDELLAGKLTDQIHFIPQWKWICDSQFRIVVDAIFRFEDIEVEFSKLKRLFMDYDFQLPIRNASLGLSFSEPEIKRLKPLILEYYRKDYELFGYPTEK